MKCGNQYVYVFMLRYFLQQNRVRMNASYSVLKVIRNLSGLFKLVSKVLKINAASPVLVQTI